MPINRDVMHVDTASANAFLDSRKGTILHEIGHYVAANLDGQICGHIIIPADARRRSGAFVPSDLSAAILCSDPARWSLVSAGGVMTEYYFCGHAKIGAAKADITAYQSVFGLMRADIVVARWKRDHLDLIAAHTACIETNFDLCVGYCDSGRFLLDDHHVIPSCVMRTPRRHGLRARVTEAVLTYSTRARRQALREFRDAHAEMASGSYGTKNL